MIEIGEEGGLAVLLGGVAPDHQAKNTTAGGKEIEVEKEKNLETSAKNFVLILLQKKKTNKN